MRLKALEIFGLFGHEDIKLHFDKCPLFLVGPNGTGKSSSLSITYYILTGQWSRLYTFPVDHLNCIFEDRNISLERDDFYILARFSSIWSVTPRTRSFSYPKTFEAARPLFRRTNSFLNDKDRFARLEARYEEYLFLYLQSSEDRDKVLYYPTYRRIERDLRELVDFDEEMGHIDLEQSIRQRFDNFGEVIGFGGQDIQILIEKSAAEIQNAARQALNEQSLRFIDVLNKQEKVKSSQLRERVTDPQVIDILIDRINLLSPNSVDTEALRSNLDLLKRKNLVRITSKEEILIYYISELMNVFERIDEIAHPLKRFCEYISSYLKPSKRADFSEQTFTISIFNVDHAVVDLDSLSSGEKQILSLFSFLMFSPDPRGRILIIDEPELSLSVSWQKRLVRDLLSTGRPDVFICATHSPFIFESFPLKDVVSLGDL